MITQSELDLIDCKPSAVGPSVEAFVKVSVAGDNLRLLGRTQTTYEQQKVPWYLNQKGGLPAADEWQYHLSSIRNRGSDGMHYATVDALFSELQAFGLGQDVTTAAGRESMSRRR